MTFENEQPLAEMNPQGALKTKERVLLRDVASCRIETQCRNSHGECSEEYLQRVDVNEPINSKRYSE